MNVIARLRGASYLSTQYTAMHEAQSFAGVTWQERVDEFTHAVPRAEHLTILDFGCGPRGGLAEQFGDSVIPYDPYIEAYADAPWDEDFDVVFSTDVLEHMTRREIAEFAERVKASSAEHVFLVVATRSAAKRLPSGANAHLTVKPADWWDAYLRKQLAPAFERVSAQADLVSQEVALYFRRAAVRTRASDMAGAEPALPPLIPQRRAGFAALAVLGAILVLITSRVVAGFDYGDEVIAALNGTFTPFDLDVFLRAGDDVLAGQSPYPNPDTFSGEANYIYPPTLALLMTPLSALPEPYAVTLYMLLSIAAIIAALRVLGVRDWRCYPVALLFPVVYESLRNGALGSFLLLVLAVLWRYRDRAVVAGTAAALAVVLKLFLWPFVLWLAFTRRVRAAAVAVGVGVAVAVGSWAVIGFAGLADYARLLELVADKESESSFSVIAVSSLFGLPYREASLVALAGGAALIAMGWRVARSESEPVERDRLSLCLVLAASLALTPIVWIHYLVLLIVPIALVRPRLSALWFLPLALWPMVWLDEYTDWPDGDIDAIAAVIALSVAVFVYAALSARRTSAASRTTRQRLV